MKHQIYFLISPRPVLVAQLNNVTEADLTDLAEPVLWSGGEHDKSRFSHHDMDVLVKVLFLDSTRRERGSEKWFKDLLAGFAATESFFDSLWTLQRISLDMSVEIAIDDALSSGTINDIGPTGNRQVDDWIDLYRQRHRRR